jgi:hypothetical protein
MYKPITPYQWPILFNTQACTLLWPNKIFISELDKPRIGANKMWMKLIKGCVIPSSPSIIYSEQKLSLANMSHGFRILEHTQTTMVRMVKSSGLVWSVG